MKKSQIVTFTPAEKLPSWAGYSMFYPPKDAPEYAVTLVDFKDAMHMMLSVYGDNFLEMLDKVINADSPYIDPFIVGYRNAVLRASSGRNGQIQIPPADLVFGEYKKFCNRHGYTCLV